MFWYNGQLIESNMIELSIHNPALLYGATVFTTMRVYQQSLEHPLTNWQAHCARLNYSLKKFNWPPPNWANIIAGVQILLEYFPALRITIFPDGLELIIGRNLPQDLAKNQRRGIEGWVADFDLQRSLTAHKTGNYLGPWLALQKAQKIGANEAILVNRQGHWLETSTGNLWGYHKGIWWTPRLQEGILAGISRKIILERACFPIKENIWTWEFVRKLEVLAYSNCIVEIIPFKIILNSQVELNFNSFNSQLMQIKKIFNQ
jgi:4-amino-4-deoxychorismate lyase